MSIRATLRAIAIAAPMLLSACTLVGPHLGPDPAIEKTYSDTPTLPNAVKVAESLRKEYSDKVESEIVTERITGIGLIGAVAVASDFALRSVNKNHILGLGLGSAAAYTGTTFLVNKPHELIYAAGANAAQCALDAIHPLRIAYGKRDDLNRSIRNMTLGVRDLDARLKPFEGATPVNTPLVLRARALTQEVNNTLPLAKDALNVLDDAGGELHSSVMAIQGQVTNAIIANSPSLQGLLDSLGQTLPALGSRITGVALPTPPTATIEKTSEDAAAVGNTLEKPTAELESLLVDVQLMIAAVQAKPSTDKLKTCNVDLTAVGLTMKVTPSDEVSVQAGTTVTVSVTGGVLPYRQATWIGTSPPNTEVELSTETGAGLITINAKSGARAGSNYTLLIRDAGQGRETVKVAVITASKDQTTPPPAAGGDHKVTTCTPDPQIKDMQQKLIDKGIKTVAINNQDKTLAADGCAGPVTDAAMRQFYKSQGENGQPVPDDAVPKGRDELFKAVLDLLKPTPPST